MAETQAASVASNGFDMPMSLSGATGAMTLSANDDAKRTEVKQKKKKKCC